MRLPEYVMCGTHGKHGYVSKGDAKRASKMYHPGEHLAVYPCDADNGLWHLGHLPPAVVRRGMDRTSLFEAPRRRR